MIVSDPEVVQRLKCHTGWTVLFNRLNLYLSDHLNKFNQSITEHVTAEEHVCKVEMINHLVDSEKK